MLSAVRESDWQLFHRAARTVVVADLVESVRLIDANEVENLALHPGFAAAWPSLWSILRTPG